MSLLKNAKSSFLVYIRERAVQDDPQVDRSERQSDFRNSAMANFLKRFSNLTNELEEMLEFYYFHCSLSMSCVSLAKGFLLLANKGRCPWTIQQVLTQSHTKRVNALMLTCGT